MAELNEEDVRRLYQDQGLSMRKVAAQLETPLASLSRFMKKHGIDTRDKAQAQKNYLKTNNHQMQGLPVRPLLLAVALYVSWRRYPQPSSSGYPK